MLLFYKKKWSYEKQTNILQNANSTAPWNFKWNLRCKILFFYVEQELLTLPKQLSSPPDLAGFVLRDLKFYVQYFVAHCLYLCPLYFVIVLSVFLCFTDSNYPLCIFNIVFYIAIANYFSSQIYFILRQKWQIVPRDYEIKLKFMFSNVHCTTANHFKSNTYCEFIQIRRY